MSTIGYLFILIALIIMRQVVRGRVMNLGEDVSDIFLAIVSGDTDALGEVLTREGESNTPTIADVQPTGNFAQASARGVSLADAAIKRGRAAKGYRWTATGPDYYDCSGLMWRACQDLGFKGSRFTTTSVASRSGFTKISSPSIGDIVLWPTHHMGVVTGDNKFYSARSRSSGIGYANINGFRKEGPMYLRFAVPGPDVQPTGNFARVSAEGLS